MVRTLSSATVCLFLFVAVFIAGCGNRPTTPPTRPLAKPCDTCIMGVSNFAKLSSALWRGAQPSKEGFRNLEAAGVKTIVNFRHDHDDLPLLAGTQLKYLWIPARAWKPEEQDLVLFLKVLEDPKNWPVFVHCAEGKDRTGYSVATYRIVVEDWSSDDAIHEMFEFHYNPIWFENPRFLQRLNAKQVLARVKMAP
jgi:tyrosine-protein phosphatase SIW14